MTGIFTDIHLRTHTPTGWPRIHYSLTARDRANMQHSASVMLRMMKETGALVALPIYDSFRTWRRGRDGEAGLDEYLKVRRGSSENPSNACTI